MTALDAVAMVAFVIALGTTFFLLVDPEDFNDD